MTDETKVDPLVYMLNRLTDLAEFAAGIGNSHDQQYTRQSAVARECDDSDLGSALLDTYTLGSNYVEAGADCATAMVRLCQPTVHRYAVFAVARASLEAFARAWWLMERGISPKERAIRGLRERCRNLRERLRLENAMGSSAVPALRRMARVRKTAEILNYPRRLGFPPDMNDLFAQAFHEAGLGGDAGEVLSRLLSAYVHGVPFAIHQQTEPALGVTQESDPRIALRTASIGYFELGFVIDAVLAVFTIAVTAQTAAYGWDLDSWKERAAATRSQALRALKHMMEVEASQGQIDPHHAG